MLSLLAVFKDILPGYRIRLPTEKELEIPVSKEVKQTRDYESMQLRLYQVSLAAKFWDAKSHILVTVLWCLCRWHCQLSTKLHQAVICEALS